jgi:hypothetical protein
MTAATREVTFAVGYRFMCTIHLPIRIEPGTATEVRVEWSPRVPQKLSVREQADYQRGRDRAFAELLNADQTGAIVDLVPELPPEGVPIQ